ncbi:MAG: UDP-2,3-diacylglucosamine diphosphatase [Betaproteobacteria bacterium]|nr:UDP-2,3-diacylglucosamine diphosphatase [Betaproteobacteria bacterium]
MKPTLFISDLHLAASRPAMVAAFGQFCAGPAREAAQLYVLGDLFDTWIGDEQLRDPMAAGVAAALAGVAAAGTGVGVMRGNRDLLLGARFAQAAGATLLPDAVVADIAGRPTLLLHGDTLCTDDLAYQEFRTKVRDPVRQRRFLALPYLARRALVALIRIKSRRATARKSETIMDVNADAVAAAFAQHRVDRMIHGHTHRPARHQVAGLGRDAERWVLPDWYDAGGYLAVDASGARMHAVAAPASPRGRA